MKRKGRTDTLFSVLFFCLSFESFTNSLFFHENSLTEPEEMMDLSLSLSFSMHIELWGLEK